MGAAEDDVAAMRVKVAAAGARARMLESRLNELRSDHAQEKQSLKEEHEKHYQRANTSESELHKIRAQFEIHKQDAMRMQQTHEEQPKAEREEKRELRSQYDEHFQRASAAEGDVHKVRTEAEWHRSEVERLTKSRAEEVEALKNEVQRINSAR